MIRIYQKGNNIVEKYSMLPNKADSSELLWVDLQDPTLEEIEQVEKTYDINIPTRIQLEEIEWSSRYTETDQYIVANSNFIQYTEESSYKSIHVSFVIKGDLLITCREGDLYSFADCVQKIKANPKPFHSGKLIFIVILETRIDFDADLLEFLAKKIHALGKDQNGATGSHANMLKQITDFQEIALFVRQNIMDKHRVISSMLRSAAFNDKEKARMQIIIEDMNSLIEHTNFIFTRLDYLQESFLGMVNIDLNRIIKIFTVISVVFMPPTLIASIYGMNFKKLPELDWEFGYPVALLSMIFSSVVILFIFKKRKWL
jgi:magnesium transporter